MSLGDIWYSYHYRRWMILTSSGPMVLGSGQTTPSVPPLFTYSSGKVT